MNRFIHSSLTILAPTNIHDTNILCWVLDTILTSCGTQRVCACACLYIYCLHTHVVMPLRLNTNNANSPYGQTNDCMHWSFDFMTASCLKCPHFSPFANMRTPRSTSSAMEPNLVLNDAIRPGLHTFSHTKPKQAPYGMHALMSFGVKGGLDAATLA